MSWSTQHFERQAAILAVSLMSLSVLCAAPSACQTAPAIAVATGESSIAVPATADALLERMSLSAGVIFAGEVIAVRRPPGFAGSSQDAAEGVVEIDLRVDQSLRGPAAGSIYTLREWSGLWAGQARRYRVGQRLLLFLYPPGRDGLSAPVHGSEGAVPLRGSGAAPGPDDTTATPSEWMVDLRWLQTQVLRKHLFATLPERPPVDPYPVRGIGVRSELAVDRPRPGAAPSLVNAITDPGHRPAPVPVEEQPLSRVLALCRQAINGGAMMRRDEAAQ